MNPHRDEAPLAEVFPRRPIELLTTRFEQFLRIEAASGFVLLGCTLLALALANSGLAPAYQAFWDQHLQISLGELRLDYPLWYWVNDGLMTLFFFVIGLEIKRELVDGELADSRKVIAPVAAAIGGALMPVLIFLAFQSKGPGRSGWAVPMATDIAFVVAALSLLGRRVPTGLKVFVLALAIVDDILAVSVIAFFYTGGVSIGPLIGAFVGLGVIVLLNRVGVRTVPAYFAVGAVIWLLTLKSGIHPTVAGVVMGLLTPASAWLGDRSLLEVLARAADLIRQAPAQADPDEQRLRTLGAVRFASREAASPLDRLQEGLHAWVAFGIMPVFALANAGVAVGSDVLDARLTLAVAVALVLGKPLGIMAATFLVVRSGWAQLPEGSSWGALWACGCLAGIGFTMSLFVASLGLEGELLGEAKGGVLIGSAASLVVGMISLHLALPGMRDRSEQRS